VFFFGKESALFADGESKMLHGDRIERKRHAASIVFASVIARYCAVTFLAALKFPAKLRLREPSAPPAQYRVISCFALEDTSNCVLMFLMELYRRQINNNPSVKMATI